MENGEARRGLILCLRGDTGTRQTLFSNKTRQVSILQKVERASAAVLLLRCTLVSKEEYSLEIEASLCLSLRENPRVSVKRASRVRYRELASFLNSIQLLSRAS